MFFPIVWLPFPPSAPLFKETIPLKLIIGRGYFLGLFNKWLVSYLLTNGKVPVTQNDRRN